jgi:hypothetical protein
MQASLRHFISIASGKARVVLSASAGPLLDGMRDPICQGMVPCMQFPPSQLPAHVCHRWMQPIRLVHLHASQLTL